MRMFSSIDVSRMSACRPILPPAAREQGTDTQFAPPAGMATESAPPGPACARTRELGDSAGSARRARQLYRDRHRLPPCSVLAPLSTSIDAREVGRGVEPEGKFEEPLSESLACAAPPPPSAHR